MMSQIQQPDAADLAVDAIGRLPAGTVFLIPVGTPLPPTLEELPLATGSLYARLQPLAVVDNSISHVVPLSSEEMNNLARAWDELVAAKSVIHVAGLPGAKADPFFEHIALTLGVRTLWWADLELDVIEESKRRQQLSAETPELPSEPSTGEEPSHVAPRLSHRGIGGGRVSRPMNPPTQREDDDDDTYTS